MALWMLQQRRDAMPSDHPYRCLIHDRDRIFSRDLDQCIHHRGLRTLKTPPRAPQANAIGERLLGTRRRACVDFAIPRTENHGRRLLQEWVAHDNSGRMECPRMVSMDVDVSSYKIGRVVYIPPLSFWARPIPESLVQQGLLLQVTFARQTMRAALCRGFRARPARLTEEGYPHHPRQHSLAYRQSW
jgi:hypothetical protein